MPLHVMTLARTAVRQSNLLDSNRARPPFEQVLMAALGIFLLSALASSAQTAGQEDINPGKAPHTQICEKPADNNLRNLTLGQPGRSSSDTQMSMVGEQPSPQGAPEPKSKELQLPEVSQVAADPQQAPLCKGKPDKSNTEPPINSTPEVQNPTQAEPPSGPVVTYGDGLLTIDPHNAPMREVIDAVRMRAGFSVEFPNESMDERVFGRVGPVTVTEALVQLLYGSGLNYIIQTSPGDPKVVRKLFLSAQASSQAKAVPPPITGSVDQENQTALYGGAGFTNDAAEETISAPVLGPRGTQPGSAAGNIPGVPAGFNLQQAATEANKTPGQILDEMQKHQEELLDAQTPQQ